MLDGAQVPDGQFESAYRDNFGFVWRTLARHGVAASGLEDAAQEVFIIVHRQWGAWVGRASMRAWLFGVARRVASSQRRTVDRHVAKLRSIPRANPPAGFDEVIAARERLDRLAAAIDALPQERRDVFVLAEVEGLASPEIADALGINLNTVYSRLRRARLAIAETMASDAVEDGRMRRSGA